MSTLSTMATGARILAALLSTLLLAACGGGTSVVPSSSPRSLNAFEQELVGDYVLEDFTLIQPGEGGFRADDFEAYDGELHLDADGFAHIRLEVCAEAGANAEGCERLFTWRADAGWLYLEGVDAAGGDAWARWTSGGMGGLTTEFCVPTNHPECEQMLVEDGYEVFIWQRTR